MANPSNSRLPVRMHLKNGRYYYVHRNRWVSLSRDYHDALVEYARLMRPATGGMQALLDRFLEDIRTRAAKSTVRTYACAIEKLRPAFVEFSPEQVKPVHIAQVLDHHRSRDDDGHRGQHVVQGGGVDHFALIMSVLRCELKLVPR